MHSEDSKVTAQCIEQYVKLDQDMKRSHPSEYEAGAKLFLANGIKQAKDHDKIVQDFGRYPHRNEVLGRKSTAEEEKYLETAIRYGQ